MFAAHISEFLILGLTLAGLAAVLAEILIKQPATLLEIVTDVRAMAQPAPRGTSIPPAVPAAANGNVAAPAALRRAA